MSVNYIPKGYHTVTPYLVTKNAAKLVDYIVKAFNGTVKSQHATPDGVVMHAEVEVGDSMIMIGEASEKWGSSAAMLYLYIPDVDATYKQAIAAGGKSLREPTNEFYGDRGAGVQDEFGNQWWMATHIEDVSDEEMMRRQQEQKSH